MTQNERFEKWCNLGDEAFIRDEDTGEYERQDIQDTWEGWQGAMESVQELITKWTEEIEQSRQAGFPTIVAQQYCLNELKKLVN